MNIKRISVEQTYHLRQQILRPNQGIEDCKFPEDYEDMTAHFGAFESKKLVGIVSVFEKLFVEPESNKIKAFNQNTHRRNWQIRAMATDESVRGKGYAMALLESVEAYVLTYAVENKSKVHLPLIWCNARSSAVGFYKKANHQVSGKEFEIEGVGPHFRMKKIVS